MIAILVPSCDTPLLWARTVGNLPEMTAFALGLKECAKWQFMLPSRCPSASMMPFVNTHQARDVKAHLVACPVVCRAPRTSRLFTGEIGSPAVCK